jgi:hypothetical protein
LMACVSSAEIGREGRKSASALPEVAKVVMKGSLAPQARETDLGLQCGIGAAGLVGLVGLSESVTHTVSWPILTGTGEIGPTGRLYLKTKGEIKRNSDGIGFSEPPRTWDG